MYNLFILKILPWVRKNAKYLRRLFWIIAFTLIFGVMIYQVRNNWQEIRDYPWQWNYWYILMGFVGYTISLLSSSWVWALIITRLSGVKQILTHIRLFCLTNAAMRLPTPIPYIGARSEAYAAQGIPRGTTLTAMSIEVTLTILSAIMVFIITSPFGLMNKIAPINLSFLLLLIPLFLIVFRPRWLFSVIQAIFNRLKRPYQVFVVNTKDMLLWLGIDILIWFNGGVLYYILANSIYPFAYHDLPLMVNVFAISGIVGWLGQIFFFLPNFGLRQIAVAYLLSFYVPWPTAVAIALLNRFVILIFELIWAIFFSIVTGRSIIKKRI